MNTAEILEQAEHLQLLADGEHVWVRVTAGSQGFFNVLRADELQDEVDALPMEKLQGIEMLMPSDAYEHGVMTMLAWLSQRFSVHGKAVDASTDEVAAELQEWAQRKTQTLKLH